MSSLTISTIVCVDCQPCSSIVGLNTRTRARPGSRLRAKFQCESAAPYRSAELALGEVLGIDLAEIGATKRSSIARSSAGARVRTNARTSSRRGGLLLPRVAFIVSSRRFPR